MQMRKSSEKKNYKIEEKYYEIIVYITFTFFIYFSIQTLNVFSNENIFNIIFILTDLHDY